MKIIITAIWTGYPNAPQEAATLGNGEEDLEPARGGPARRPPAASNTALRIQPLLAKDIADLTPSLASIANERLAAVKVQLVKRGEEEARSLTAPVGATAQSHPRRVQGL